MGLTNPPPSFSLDLMLSCSGHLGGLTAHCGGLGLITGECSLPVISSMTEEADTRWYNLFGLANWGFAMFLRRI